MTCRQCAVPTCEVLLITAAPMCRKHWERTPQKVKDEIAAAEGRIARAMSTTGRAIAEIERQAAMDVACAWAAGIARPSTDKAPAISAGPIAG